jgi:hypothetical protein
VVFDIYITDLKGNVLATVTRYKDVEITRPIGESREARFAISNHDPAVAHLYFTDAQGYLIGALGRMIRIKYRGSMKRGIWGYAHVPSFASGGYSTIGVHDPSLRLKKWYSVYGDAVTGPSGAPSPRNPSDYRAILAIRDAANLNDAQVAAGIPSHGIIDGTNTGKTVPPADENVFYTTVERGSGLWDKMQEVAGGAYGAEIDLEPYEPTAGELPFNGTTKPYKYARLHTWDFQGVNRTGVDLSPIPETSPVEYYDPYDPANEVMEFIYDDQTDGVTNCAGITWDPDGDAVKNNYTGLVASNNEDERGKLAQSRALNSWINIGIWQGWEAVSGANNSDVSMDNLAGLTRAAVEKYGRPPNHFKITLHTMDVDNSQAWHPRYGIDFDLGDRIRAKLVEGYINTGWLVGRIMSVKVQQADQAGNTVTEIDCVAHSVGDAEITTWTRGPEDGIWGGWTPPVFGDEFEVGG